VEEQTERQTTYATVVKKAERGRIRKGKGRPDSATEGIKAGYNSGNGGEKGGGSQDKERHRPSHK